MEISKQQMVEFAQWMDDAARTIEKWAQHAPDYFKKKGRLLVDVDRFDERAQAIRDFLAAAKGVDTPAPGQPPNDNMKNEACVKE